MPDMRAEVFTHNLRANEQLLDACEPLADADLDATLGGVYGTIRAKLVHMFAAETRYVASMRNLPPPQDLHEDKPFPGFDVLRTSASTTGNELLELAMAVGRTTECAARAG